MSSDSLHLLYRIYTKMKNHMQMNDTESMQDANVKL